MKLVIIESPFAGDVIRNTEYAQKCMRDCLKRGEAPYASHLLYTQPNCLDDKDPVERKLGIDAGFAWRGCADLTVFYEDLGWSGGMRQGLDDCRIKGLPYEIRTLAK